MLLAVDVGFAASGWITVEEGKIVGCGVIKTEKTQKKGTRVSDDHSHRSMVLARGFINVINEYSVSGIIGELPSGGAQSAKAMGFMMSAISVISSVACLYDLPVEWCTPGDVKKAVTGKRSASKEEIIEKTSEIFGFKKEGKRYAAFGKTYPKGEWEHIADSMGCYLALKEDNLAKIFG